ncbi:MAG: hypothetical protein FWC56_00595, partial [Phycisphaerae bacterium]|nr:hypothetical protein [Phycisphaerae bacterium]
NESRESIDSAENISSLQAKTSNPYGFSQWVGPPPTLYHRPDGGKETFIERAARYRQECNGLPPGASQPNGRFRLIDNTSAQAATGEADADKTLAEACSDDIDADKTPADSFEMGFCQLSVLSVTEEPPDKS